MNESLTLGSRAVVGEKLNMRNAVPNYSGGLDTRHSLWDCLVTALFKAFSSESTIMMTRLDVGCLSCCSISVASAKYDTTLTTLDRISL